MEKNLGHATAYGYAKSKGYSGTEEEFAELMADYASVGQSAAQSAEQAAASATSASGSAATASQAAQTATSKASEAVTAAGTATTKASEASQSASTASTAATSASTSAQTATTAASTATTKADAAAASEAAALSAKTDAESARDAAAQSASEAAASAESIDPETLEHKAYGAYVVESASGVIASFADGADSIPMKDVLVHIEPVQEGSGDPSPDNVRPITGWTGAKVTRCGKNLLISTAIKTNTKSGVTATKNDDGSITLNGTATGNDTFEVSGSSSQNRISIKVNDTVTLSGCPSGGSNSTYRLVAYLYKNNTYTNIALIDTGNNYVRKTDFDSLYCVISIYSGVTYDNLTFYPQLELGSTATDYEPYSGQTYDVTFPAEAGTVYGGTLDVTSWVLNITHKMYTFDGSENWRWSTVSLRPYFVFADIAHIKPVVTNLYPYSAIATAIEKTITTNGGQGDGIWVKDSEFAPDLASWNAFLSTNPLQVVYELATPITYQLTPQEITSLLGTNNLWADTGDTEVEYRADTKLYITKKITEAVSALS